MRHRSPTDIYGLRASVRSNHWRTPCVRALTPFHYASVIDNPNRVRAPLRPSTYILDYRISLAPGPTSVQPVDGLFVVGPLTPTAISSVARSSYACASYKPSPGVSPEAPSPVRVLSRVLNNTGPLLRFQGMTFGYLWQAGSCGLLKSYCFPF